ncbi:phosphonate C-P lyase system protein PhnH [Rhizobium sp. LjRoot254]|uniref:phosphonate C-P lyase system protein PhnH n=1 Tax=Rhizobium sp. LjRoot254 TaxID=3342297 RepID=UPI003ECF01D6
MAYRTESYTGGFADPVFEAQSTFKILMDCMARPGTIATVSAPSAPPLPLGPGAGAIALTLCDHDTPVYLSPALMGAGVQGWLAFQTGSLLTEDRAEAAFAFFEKGAALPALSTFSMGSQEYPDRSTTIIAELPDLTGGAALTLSGPGIDGEATIAPQGLPPHFENMWRENAALYPRGVDLVLVSGSDILCLPRTTKIAKRGA